MELQMKNNNRSLNPLILAFFVLMSPFASAYAACCAGHGGVASCNHTTGQKICKDGTASPTCTCPIKKAKAIKAKAAKAKAVKTKTVKTKAVKTKAVKKTSPLSTTNSTTKSKATLFNTTTNAQGCCSRHGGISQCNKFTGKQMCNDGTASPSCTCH